MAIADWLSVDPTSGDGGSSSVNVTASEGESVFGGGHLPRSTSFTVKTASGVTKEVSIQQKGFSFIQPLVVSVVRQSNTNYAFTLGYSTYPPALIQAARLCVKRICVRFGGYAGTQGGQPSFPLSWTFFPPEDMENVSNAKTIYHGNANGSHVFGDTSGDSPLIDKWLNFVEYNFEDEVQDYTKTFSPSLLITGEAEPESLPCYIQFGHEATEGEEGDSDGLVWGGNVRITPPTA